MGESGCNLRTLRDWGCVGEAGAPREMHPTHGPTLVPPSPTPTWTRPTWACLHVRACDGGREQEEFQATVTAIMERYYAKYRGKGGLEEGEVAQSSPGGEEAGPSSAPVPAPSPVPAAV